MSGSAAIVGIRLSWRVAAGKPGPGGCDGRGGGGGRRGAATETGPATSAIFPTNADRWKAAPSRAPSSAGTHIHSVYRAWRP